jgi:signal peptidase I
MEPNIAVGQTIRLDGKPYRNSAEVRRGDIIVFRAPVDAKRLFVKRVVALPGERVSATAGRVSVNGVELGLRSEGEATIENAGAVSYRVKVILPCGEQSAETVVPSEAFFVMGDNRCASVDSRRFGPVGFSAIVGKVVP